jgi:hypothetical protein
LTQDLAGSVGELANSYCHEALRLRETIVIRPCRDEADSHVTHPAP